MYKSEGIQNISPNEFNWRLTLRQHSNLLERKFEEVEVWSAIKSLVRNKAHGHSFDNIGRGILRDFLAKFDRSGLLNACIRETFICLISKMDTMEKVKGIRLISFTTSTYKIMAKVHIERLKKVISSTISMNQSSFIEGRQLDPLLIVNEVVKYYRIKKKRGWYLKLDLEKAFDKVD